MKVMHYFSPEMFCAKFLVECPNWGPGTYRNRLRKRFPLLLAVGTPYRLYSLATGPPQFHEVHVGC